jgi:hypothetical protein
MLILAISICACTPAETPEQLSFTPGAPFIVTENTFTTNDFSLRYPDGWRIVTGPADAPQVITFVSPDNCAIILVAIGSTEPITSPDCADVNFQTIHRQVTIDDLLLTVAGSAPDAHWEVFETTFEAFARSVQPASPRD